MLNFDFLEKGLGKVSPLHFVYDFSKNQVNLRFLIKPFFDMTENSRQEFKYHENQKSI